MNSYTKTLALCTFLLSIHSALWSQLTLAKEVDYSLTVEKINRTDYKYYLLDFSTDECIIYNLDHSIWKTISLPVPSGFYSCELGLVSQHLFNTDDKIELVYVYYNYIQTSPTDGYYVYGSIILNEDGEILLTNDGIRYSYIKEIGDSNYQLFMYGYNYSVWPNEMWTDIYNIGGISEEIKEIYFNSANSLKSMQISALYPVPANETVTIEYELLQNTDNVFVKIYSSSGILVDSKQIDNTFSSLILDVSSYSSGGYSFSIEDGMSVLSSGTFIVAR